MTTVCVCKNSHSAEEIETSLNKSGTLAAICNHSKIRDSRISRSATDFDPDLATMVSTRTRTLYTLISFASTDAFVGSLHRCGRGGSLSNVDVGSTSDPYPTSDEFQRRLLEAQLDNRSSIEDNGSGVNGDDEPTANAAPIDIQAVQNSLLRVCAGTDRGQCAKAEQHDEMSRMVSKLEGVAPMSDDPVSSIPPSLAGTWELVYSNVQLFRSSPFFLAGRETCKTEDEAKQYAWFCDMHRAALAISTIGVVRQVISSSGKLVNEFEVKVGSIPFLSDFVPFLTYSGGLPVTVDGAIVSTADITPITSSEWELYMDTVEIKGSNVPFLRDLLDSGNIALKSRALSDLLEQNIDSYERPRPKLRTTYFDDSMRICRDKDDNVFVYARVSESEDPTNYEDVMADLGIGSLLENFNDSVAKIYL